MTGLENTITLCRHDEWLTLNYIQYDKTEKWVYIYFKIQTKYNTIKLRKSIYLLQTSNNIQYDKTKKRVYIYLKLSNSKKFEWDIWNYSKYLFIHDSSTF